MRRVIVNSTPLIVLCGIGKLDILRKLYCDIFIPDAVYREVLVKAKQKGIVEKIAPLLSDMKRNGFYIDSVLEMTVLEQAGELERVI